MFSSFKKIKYPLYKDDEVVFDKEVSDISRAFVLSSNLIKEGSGQFSANFYELAEYETPQMVSESVYSSPKYYWVILVVNQIINPYTDWFMNPETLRSYVIKKYTTVKPSFDHFLSRTDESGKLYSDILTKIKLKNPDGYVSDLDFIDLIKKYKEYEKFFSASVLDGIHHYEDIRDSSTVNDWLAEEYFSETGTLPEYIRIITNYEYEYSENQKRKIIKVLEPRYLDEFVESVKDILGA